MGLFAERTIAFILQTFFFQVIGLRGSDLKQGRRSYLAKRALPGVDRLLAPSFAKIPPTRQDKINFSVS